MVTILIITFGAVFIGVVSFVVYNVYKMIKDMPDNGYDNW